MYMDKHTEARGPSNQSPAAVIFVCAFGVPLNQIQKLLIIYSLLLFIFYLKKLAISLQNLGQLAYLIPLESGKTVYENPKKIPLAKRTGSILYIKMLPPQVL